MKRCNPVRSSRFAWYGWLLAVAVCLPGTGALAQTASPSASASSSASEGASSPATVISPADPAAANVESSAAEAGDPAARTALQARLDNAGLCQSLQFDLRDISGLIGLPVPSFIPIDTNLRWNQSRHIVTRYAVTPSKVALDFKFGCEPTSNGTVLTFLGLTPARLRLSNDVSCEGTRGPDGKLDEFQCVADGRIGRFLDDYIVGLSEKVRAVLPIRADGRLDDLREGSGAASGLSDSVSK